MQDLLAVTFISAFTTLKRDAFRFPVENFLWMSGDVPRLPSYGNYIPLLVRFASPVFYMRFVFQV